MPLGPALLKSHPSQAGGLGYGKQGPPGSAGSKHDDGRRYLTNLDHAVAVVSLGRYAGLRQQQRASGNQSKGGRRKRIAAVRTMNFFDQPVPHWDLVSFTVQDMSNILVRDALRNDENIVAALDAYWTCCVTETGCWFVEASVQGTVLSVAVEPTNAIIREVFVALAMNLHMCLFPNATEAEARYDANQEWVTALSDDDRRVLDETAFCNWLFSVVDAWCDTISVPDYCGWLNTVAAAVIRTARATSSLRPLSEVPCLYAGEPLTKADLTELAGSMRGWYRGKVPSESLLKAPVRRNVDILSQTGLVPLHGDNLIAVTSDTEGPSVGAILDEFLAGEEGSRSPTPPFDLKGLSEESDSDNTSSIESQAFRSDESRSSDEPQRAGDGGSDSDCASRHSGSSARTARSRRSHRSTQSGSSSRSSRSRASSVGGDKRGGSRGQGHGHGQLRVKRRRTASERLRRRGSAATYAGESDDDKMSVASLRSERGTRRTSKRRPPKPRTKIVYDVPSTAVCSRILNEILDIVFEFVIPPSRSGSRCSRAGQTPSPHLFASVREFSIQQSLGNNAVASGPPVDPAGKAATTLAEGSPEDPDGHGHGSGPQPPSPPSRPSTAARASPLTLLGEVSASESADEGHTWQMLETATSRPEPYSRPGTATSIDGGTYASSFLSIESTARPATAPTCDDEVIGPYRPPGAAGNSATGRLTRWHSAGPSGRTDIDHPHWDDGSASVDGWGGSPLPECQAKRKGRDQASSMSRTAAPAKSTVSAKRKARMKLKLKEPPRHPPLETLKESPRFPCATSMSGFAASPTSPAGITTPTTPTTLTTLTTTTPAAASPPNSTLVTESPQSIATPKFVVVPTATPSPSSSAAAAAVSTNANLALSKTLSPAASPPGPEDSLNTTPPLLGFSADHHQQSVHSAAQGDKAPAVVHLQRLTIGSEQELSFHSPRSPRVAPPHTPTDGVSPSNRDTRKLKLHRSQLVLKARRSKPTGAAANSLDNALGEMTNEVDRQMPVRSGWLRRQPRPASDDTRLKQPAIFLLGATVSDVSPISPTVREQVPSQHQLLSTPRSSRHPISPTVNPPHSPAGYGPPAALCTPSGSASARSGANIMPTPPGTLLQSERGQAGRSPCFSTPPQNSPEQASQFSPSSGHSPSSLPFVFRQASAQSPRDLGHWESSPVALPYAADAQQPYNPCTARLTQSSDICSQAGADGPASDETISPQQDTRAQLSSVAEGKFAAVPVTGNDGYVFASVEEAAHSPFAHSTAIGENTQHASQLRLGTTLRNQSSQLAVGHSHISKPFGVSASLSSGPEHGAPKGRVFGVGSLRAKTGVPALKQMPQLSMSTGFGVLGRRGVGLRDNHPQLDNLTSRRGSGCSSSGLGSGIWVGPTFQRAPATAPTFTAGGDMTGSGLDLQGSSMKSARGKDPDGTPVSARGLPFGGCVQKGSLGGMTPLGELAELAEVGDEDDSEKGDEGDSERTHSEGTTDARSHGFTGITEDDGHDELESRVTDGARSDVGSDVALSSSDAHRVLKSRESQNSAASVASSSLGKLKRKTSSGPLLANAESVSNFRSDHSHRQGENVAEAPPDALSTSHGLDPGTKVSLPRIPPGDRPHTVLVGAQAQRRLYSHTLRRWVGERELEGEAEGERTTPLYRLGTAPNPRSALQSAQASIKPIRSFLESATPAQEVSRGPVPLLCELSSPQCRPLSWVARGEPLESCLGSYISPTISSLKSGSRMLRIDQMRLDRKGLAFARDPSRKVPHSVRRSVYNIEGYPGRKLVPHSQSQSAR
eukprot:Rmarinus@m.3680